jgi:hypothetical protein
VYIDQSVYFLLTTIRLNIISIRIKQKLSQVSIFAAGRICVVLCGARINSTKSDKYNMKLGMLVVRTVRSVNASLLNDCHKT